jgi:SAM-dependent methyltransferase
MLAKSSMGTGSTPASVDLYSSYSNFADQVLNAIRQETFGVDIGQNSWTTADEYQRLFGFLDLTPESRVLEVASGSGGPARFLAQATGCHVTGIDASESGVEMATKAAAEAGESDKVRFLVADATAKLPFDENSFDGLICIDAMNHFLDRLAVLREWRRVLRPRKRAVFTDPVVITGPVTNHELAGRSSVGLFLFVPPAINKKLIEQAGLRLVHQEDITENAALISGRWRDARAAHKDELIKMEGQERYEGLQRFFDSVHTLTSERRLSRIVYIAEEK